MASTSKKRLKTARRKPLQERSRRTVAAILEAAARLFVRRGYEATSTNHVAERAGVSIGTLYEYFPDKESLVLALLDSHLALAEGVLEQAMAKVATAKERPLAATVSAMVDAIVELHRLDPLLHRVLFEQALSVRAVRRRKEKLEEAFSALVTELLANHPEACAPRPQLSARIVVQAVDHLVHNWILHEDEAVDAELYRAEIVRLVTAYLVAR